jgi:catechol 2,3-dioxygenase
MGHVHLKVADIEQSIAFYRDVVGLALMAQLGPYAGFLSAGGYHHHIGANTWESAGGKAPPPGAAALRHATILLPGLQERDRLVARLERADVAVRELHDLPLVADPSGNELVLALTQ